MSDNSILGRLPLHYKVSFILQCKLPILDVVKDGFLDQQNQLCQSVFQVRLLFVHISAGIKEMNWLVYAIT